VDRVCAYLSISTDRLKIVGATNYNTDTGDDEAPQVGAGRFL